MTHGEFAAPYVPTAYETSVGYVPGFRATDSARTHDEPRSALGSVLDDYLSSGAPVYVAFSGGRDSSVLLAAAIDRARIMGRQDPVPLTLRYPGEAQADEAGWQGGVISYLGLERWDVVNVPPGDHDLVGPIAADSLLRHGVLWPAPAATRSTLLEAARGGFLMTGEGGDEVFADGRTAMLSALARRAVPLSGERLRLCAQGCAPRPLRQRHLARAVSDRLPHAWLQPATLEIFHHQIVNDLSSEPLRRDRGVLQAASSRSAALGAQTYRWLAAQPDSEWVEPFRDPRFVSALARWAGRFGPGGRTRTMGALFSDLLPPSVLQRRDKATFQHAYLGRHTRTFAQAWQGDGVPHEFVDWKQLRHTWLDEDPDASSSLLLQAAWLATEGQS